MDPRPPESVDESFTISQAKWLNKFSNVIGAVVGAITLLDQAGAGALLPAKIQKYVTPGILTIGLVALYTGHKKQGAALIANHSSRPYVYTPDGKPGRNKKDALFQVFMTATEVALAQKATSGELVPPNTAQKQEKFEEKILSKLDQFKPQVFPADERVVLPPVDVGVTSHFAPNPVPSKGRKISLSDLAAIAQGQN